MPSIRKGLLQLIFSGAAMKRWNDKLRPIELVEVDKQAHKMMVAWILAELNTRDMDPDRRLDVLLAVIEGGLFEYLYRLVITDIKPPVFYKIKTNPEHYRRLTTWVMRQLAPRIQTLGEPFHTRLAEYLSKPDHTDLPGRILSAAHVYASRYEFCLIQDNNRFDEEMQGIASDFEQMMVAHRDLAGVDELLDSTSAVGRFAHLCGRLRFQTRWSQTPRIPETSVLGHLFIVASYVYLFSLELDACRARRVNNFFAGLFHDLPEVLTRDIISPVKKSVEGIADIIRAYELQALEERIMAPLKNGGHEDLTVRLGYLLGLETGSEFDTVIRESGPNGPVVRKVVYEELCGAYNDDSFDPIDGGLLKICDSLAAFIEAYAAVRNGISADQLQRAISRIQREYELEPLRHGVHIGALMADFD